MRRRRPSATSPSSSMPSACERLPGGPVTPGDIAEDERARWSQTLADAAAGTFLIRSGAGSPGGGHLCLNVGVGRGPGPRPALLAGKDDMGRCTAAVDASPADGGAATGGTPTA